MARRCVSLGRRRAASCSARARRANRMAECPATGPGSQPPSAGRRAIRSWPMRWTSTRTDRVAEGGAGAEIDGGGPAFGRRPRPGRRRRPGPAAACRCRPRFAVGKADLRAAAGAVRDHAANAIRRGEQPFAPLDVAGRNQFPDPRAGDERAVDFDRRHDVERDAGRGGQLSRAARSCPRDCGRNRSSGLRPAPGPRACRGRSARKTPAADKLQQRLVGRIGDDPIDAVRGQQLGLAFGPSQRRRALLGPQQPHRVRIERKHDRRAADAVRPLQAAAARSRRARDARRRNCRSPRRRRGPRPGRSVRWRMMCMAEGTGCRSQDADVRTKTGNAFVLIP